MTLMILRNILILRKPRSGCLEGRTALIQPIGKFFHGLSFVVVCRARSRRIANSVNSPTRPSAAIVPPCCWATMSQLIDRPRPVPSPVGLVVKNG